MTIVAIAMVSLVEATGSYVKNTAFLQDKVIAHWVASNTLNELLLKQSFPSKSEKQGSESMAGQAWVWKTQVKETPDKAFRAIHVKVFKGDSKNSLATLVTYAGSAIAECEAASAQPASCHPWVGVAAANSTAPGNQNAP